MITGEIKASVCECQTHVKKKKKKQTYDLVQNRKLKINF